jgi:hypothetical protein
MELQTDQLRNRFFANYSVYAGRDHVTSKSISHSSKGMNVNTPNGRQISALYSPQPNRCTFAILPKAEDPPAAELQEAPSSGLASDT